MPASVDIREGIGEAFDALSDEFLSGASVTLVKASDDYGNEYDSLLLLASKRFFEFKENRKFIFLEIADDSDELNDAMANATHIQVDVGSNDPFIYAINTSDTIAPLSTDVTWKLNGQIVSGGGGHYS